MTERSSLPQANLAARNWRKRAEQMYAIAEALASGRTREVLRRKADGLMELAKAAERTALQTRRA